MGEIEDDLMPHARDALDLFGEPITVQNYTYEGTHPGEGTPQWSEDDPVIVQGRITENQRPMEGGDTSGQRVTGEYYAFLPNDVGVEDGLQSDTVRASVLIGSDGFRYDVLRVMDEHNGLYRCQCSYEGQ